jgi:hypothetical protein
LTSDPHNDEVIVHYLLGELPEEKQTELEERYFADDELHDRVRAVETELAEAYVRGELGARDRERFEARLAASPRLGERVAFVRALLKVLPEPEEARPASPAPSRWAALLGAVRLWPAGLRIAMAAAAALLVLGGLWVVYRAWRTPERPPEQAGPGQNAPPGEAPRPPDVPPEGPEPAPPPVVAPPPQPETPAVVALALTPGLSRGESRMPRLVLPAGTKQVRLTLPLGGETGTGYRATLRRADTGGVIWQLPGLRTSGKGTATTVVVNVPARLFQEKSYVVTLDRTVDGETETVEEYPFRVTLRVRQ